MIFFIYTFILIYRGYAKLKLQVWASGRNDPDPGINSRLFIVFATNQGNNLGVKIASIIDSL